MAKKKLLLNESVTRRFMKLAELKPTYVSNFLREADEPEEELDDEEEDVEDEDTDLEDEGDDLGDDMDLEGDDLEGDMGDDADAEGLVMDLIKNAIAPWAKENGVDMDVNPDEEEDMEDDDLEGDMGLEEEPLEGGEEEPLEGGEEPLEGGEEDMDMEANKGIYEARRNLRRANVSVINESTIINKVVQRVAARLLKESKKSKSNSRTKQTSRRRRSTKRR